MRALILGAGLGTRLSPQINKINKVMVKIGKKPLLYYHLELLKKYGITDIWINLHHLPHSIKAYFGDGTRFGVKLNYSFEEKLLGTAGALKNPLSGIEEEFRKGQFLVVYGDNLTDFDYSELVNQHGKKKSIMTIGLYKSETPWTKGVVETNSQERVLKFVEKPPQAEISSDLVNGGVYLCEPKLLEYIPSGGLFSDFGFDIFPKLLEQNFPIYSLQGDYYFQDIGTTAGLKKARKDFKMGKLKT